jgi:hypothetical protein
MVKFPAALRLFFYILFQDTVPLCGGVIKLLIFEFVAGFILTKLSAKCKYTLKGHPELVSVYTL